MTVKEQKQVNHSVNYHDILGKFPKHISKDEVIDYFVYVFELDIKSLQFSLVHKHKGTQHFLLDEINRLNYKWEDLSAEKIWWLCYLISTKMLCDLEGYNYASHAINQVLGKIDRLDEQMLDKFCNEIQFVLYEDDRACLLPRPLALKELQSSLCETDYYLSYLEQNKEDFIKVLDKYLHEDVMYPEALNQYKENKLVQKFLTFNEWSFELFMRFFLSVHQVFSEPAFPILKETSKNESFEMIVNMYIEQVLARKENQDELFSSLMEIVKPMESIKRTDDE